MHIFTTLSKDVKSFINQPDKNGFTAVHLATRHGRTSTIETLVSHGANLNIAARLGATCLHTAVSQCQTPSQAPAVEVTAAMRKISQDLAEYKLPPEKLLVVYLLELGANPNIRDKREKTALQHVLDQNFKEAILSRLSTLKVSSKDNATARRLIDDRGGELSIPSYGFTLSIPPGALAEGTSKEIAVEVLTDIPNNFQLQDDEILASHGFCCNPSGLKFIRPVKLELPHSAVLDDPQRVQTVLYSCHAWDSLTEDPSTLKSTQTCGTSTEMENDTQELKSGAKPVKKEVVNENKSEDHTEGHTSGQGATNVTKKERSGSRGGKKHNRTRNASISDTQSEMDSLSSELGQMNLGDSAASQGQEIQNVLCARTSRAEVGSRASDDVQTNTNQTSSESSGTRTKKDPGARSKTHTVRSTVTDDSLNELSRHIPHTKYIKLCSKLEVGYNEANSILQRFRTDYVKATRDCLNSWKDRTGGSVPELEEILQEIGLGGLIDYVI